MSGSQLGLITSWKVKIMMSRGQFDGDTQESVAPAHPFFDRTSELSLIPKRRSSGQLLSWGHTFGAQTLRGCAPAHSSFARTRFASPRPNETPFEQVLSQGQ